MCAWVFRDLVAEAYLKAHPRRFPLSVVPRWLTDEGDGNVWFGSA